MEENEFSFEILNVCIKKYTQNECTKEIKRTKAKHRRKINQQNFCKHDWIFHFDDVAENTQILYDL